MTAINLGSETCRNCTHCYSCLRLSPSTSTTCPLTLQTPAQWSGQPEKEDPTGKRKNLMSWGGDFGKRKVKR